MAEQFRSIQQMDKTPAPADQTKAIERLKDSMAPKVRRRNRQILSCLSCRRRKLKCDKQQPACANCKNSGQDCTFLAPALDTMSQRKLNEIKERMGTIERTLEDDVLKRKAEAKRKNKGIGSQDLPGEQSDSGDEKDQLVPEDEKGLEATPLATVDAVYDNADDVNDDQLDFGFCVGRFRMGERLGGLYRPKLREEMIFALLRDNKRGTDPEAPLKDDSTSFLLAGPDFVMPGAGMLFGDAGSSRSFIQFLPTKEGLDLLTHNYKERYHPLARVVHWPTFEEQYNTFWTSVLSGIEPTYAVQSIVFAVAYAGVTTMAHADVRAVFQQEYREVLLNFHRATEVALSKANILRTTKFEVLQALIIYLIPQCRGEVSRAHSVLCGAAIRLGESFSLHRDPVSAFAHSPIDAHVRRLAWFQLCFLDFRTSESQGPRPYIKRDDYDTKLPWNLDDTDLVHLQPGPHQPVVDLKEKEAQWTDVTLSKMRFECNEMHRVVWHDRVRLDKGRITITHVLSKIEKFRSAMMEKYNWLSEEIPLQAYAKRVLTILMLRMHIMILHKYHNSTSTRIPDRLRQIVLSSGTSLSEAALQLDVDDRFKQYRHYNSALQQWHTAFLLLSEIFIFPMRKEADRIWTVCDHVFQPDKSLPRVQKARSILAAVRDRAGAYRDMRKLREPVSMRNRLKTELPARARVRGPDMIAPAESVLPVPITVPDFNRPLVRNSQGSADYLDHQPTVSTMARKDSSAYDSLKFDSPYTLLQPHPELNKGYGQSTTVSPPAFDGPSPSSSNMTEGWPPSISVVQQATFRYTNNSESPYRSSASPPNYSMQYGSEQRPMFGNSALGVVSGEYMPEIKHSSTFASSPNDPCATQRSPNQSFDATYVAPNTTLPGWTSIQQAPMPAASDMPMLDLNWDEWNAIFPPDINNGVLDLPG